jgi:hypothetical protein
LYVIEGMAWSQADVVSAVEYRIGNGAWKSATFNETTEPLAALQRFSWTIALDLDTLEKGNQIVEIRGLNEAGVQSLPVSITVMGSGDGSSTLGVNYQVLLFFLPLLLLIFILITFLLVARTDAPLGLWPDDSEASIEATLASDVEMADTIDAILVEGVVAEKKRD